MTYWALNAVFLAVVAVTVAVAVIVGVRRTRASGSAGARRRRRLLGALGVTTALLLVLTAVFDNVMIAVGLVGYAPELISGAFVGIAPLEDFAYAIAAALLLPSLWVLLERRES